MKKKPGTSRKYMIVLAGMIILWILFIWRNSMVAGPRSAAISLPFEQWFEPLLTWLGVPMRRQSDVVRKMAHMAEFFVLGTLMFIGAGILPFSRKNVRRRAVTALVMSVALASMDEIIQCFTPERGPSVFDVGIDTVGACIGISASILFRRYWKRKTSGKEPPEDKGKTP